MVKKNNKRAFTLVETLIMVAVVGIIAVISVVSLKNMRPDKDAVLVRKVYSEISKAVTALANDVELYPSNNIFKDTSKPNGIGEYTEQNKFAYNFVKMFDAITYNNCTMRVCEFVTIDGIKWKVTDNFSSSNNSQIEVDIYGKGKSSDIYYFNVNYMGTISVKNGEDNTDKAKSILKSRKVTAK